MRYNNSKYGAQAKKANYYGRNKASDDSSDTDDDQDEMEQA